jgi:hypothetical protein
MCFVRPRAKSDYEAPRDCVFDCACLSCTGPCAIWRLASLCCATSASSRSCAKRGPSSRAKAGAASVAVTRTMIVAKGVLFMIHPALNATAPSAAARLASHNGVEAARRALARLPVAPLAFPPKSSTPSHEPRFAPFACLRTARRLPIPYFGASIVIPAPHRLKETEDARS